MNILDRIVQHKKKEVAANKELYPVKLLEKSVYFAGTPVSLRSYLERADKFGIIAEIKRKSPSRGVLNPQVSVEDLSIGYMQAGASALSVLTDKEFFGGTNEDLSTARRFNFCPILRKDFLLEEYQVLEAKSAGADAILLIARILSAEQVKSLAAAARSLGMEVLLEVHTSEELDRYCPDVGLVGVNNRDLDTLSMDIETSLRLAASLPKGACKVTESGISTAAAILKLKNAGYQGFLIGEAFMSTAHPARSCAKLISEIGKGAA